MTSLFINQSQETYLLEDCAAKRLASSFMSTTLFCPSFRIYSLNYHLSQDWEEPY